MKKRGGAPIELCAVCGEPIPRDPGQPRWTKFFLEKRIEAGRRRKTCKRCDQTPLQTRGELTFTADGRVEPAPPAE